MDKKTTIMELRKLVEQFVQERDWSKFHNPKNVSMALAGEAAELMEHFQWLNQEESCNSMKEDDFRGEVQDELADVIIYALAFANRNDIDLDTIIRKKMDKNRLKYPVGQFKGRF